MQKKPKLIIISGAPGSGKSTLAKKLTEYIQFIYIDTDAVLQNIWLNNTENKDYDREKVGIPKLYELLATLGSAHELNLIIDMSPTDEVSKSKLSEAFELKHIHCEANNTIERFYQRELNENGEEPDWLGPHMKELEDKLAMNSKPPQLGAPIIVVNTDNDYVPGLGEVINELDISDGYKLWSQES